jgi:membrane protein DedA with SNARE-associated domain
VEEFIRSLADLNPVLVYAVVASIAYAENVFPPFPSDVMIVFAGSLASLGTIDFTAILLLTTIASTLGFMTMYKLGDWFGLRILEAGKLKFIPRESVHKVEGWFRRYGYSVVIANRFLAGTRAVISFFAGMSELSFLKTSVLSFFSALVWDFLLLLAGRKLGENWQAIALYLETYSKAVTAIVIIAILILVARYLYNRSAANKRLKNHA